MNQQQQQQIVSMSIHPEGVPSRKRMASLGAWLALSGMLLLPVPGIAQNILMQDNGSTAVINPGTGTGLLGMNNWSMDTFAENQLNQQWFWYSINGGVAQTIDTLGTPSVTTALNDGGTINDVALTYNGSQLQVNIEYVLTGNGTGTGGADIQEYIQLVNMGTTPINLSFFQYSDFNLLGGLNDKVKISGSIAKGFSGATQTTGVGGSGIAEVIDAPNANFAEANTVGGEFSTLYKLNNTTNLTLNCNQNAGAGDVTWALQWTATLAAGEELDITKDKGLSIEIVPEPTTVALIVLGAAMLGSALRRRMA
jgi:hypothetical protein